MIAPLLEVLVLIEAGTGWGKQHYFSMILLG
jgi:hypothetical protein